MVSGAGVGGIAMGAGADAGAAIGLGAASVAAGNKANQLADEMAKRRFDSLRNVSAGGRPLPSMMDERLDQAGQTLLKTLPSTYDRNQR